MYLPPVKWAALLLVLVVGGGFLWWQDQSKLSGKDLASIAMEHVEVESADGTTQIHPLDEPEDQAVAEGQAARRIAMTMQDWVTKLEGFLTLNDREILRGAGRISADLAKNHAEQEFTKFRTLENASLESDFDKMVKSLPAPRKGK